MTLPSSYFDDLYAVDRDPWRFESRWYEKRKYALTMASLPHERYERALEIGCSVGVLTAMLAHRCVDLLAIDTADAAVLATTSRLEGRPGVRVERRSVPADWPEGRFDLIVLSEVGYYFDEPDLERLLACIDDSLAPDGALVAVHWRHPVSDYPLGGDRVHEIIAATPGRQRTVQHLETDFVLEVYGGSAAASVAQTTGLIR